MRLLSTEARFVLPWTLIFCKDLARANENLVDSVKWNSVVAFCSSERVR